MAQERAGDCEVESWALAGDDRIARETSELTKNLLFQWENLYHSTELLSHQFSDVSGEYRNKRGGCGAHFINLVVTATLTLEHSREGVNCSTVMAVTKTDTRTRNEERLYEFETSYKFKTVALVCRPVTDGQ